MVPSSPTQALSLGSGKALQLNLYGHLCPDLFSQGLQSRLAARHTARHGGMGESQSSEHGGKYSEHKNTCNTDEQFDWIMLVNWDNSRSASF